MEAPLKANDLIEKIIQGKKKYIKIFPQHVVRASEVGHPCERYLVYSITHWDQRTPHPPEVQFIFEGGRLVEELAIKDFEDAGFRVYRPEPDKAIAESKPRITGHIDIRTDFGDGTVYTGEIKGLNIYDFNQLNSIKDFHESKKPWIKKYPGQLMTYMYIKNEEWGFFYLKSIPRFQPKLIWVHLDYEYMEELLQKTERIEKHVANKTLPEGLNDITMCEYCAFRHICLPDILREGMEIVDNDELHELLDRYHELKPYVSEYNKIDKRIKEMVKEKPRLMVGSYVVTGNWVERKGFTVPASSYWKSKIMALDKTSEEVD